MGSHILCDRYGGGGIGFTVFAKGATEFQDPLLYLLAIFVTFLIAGLVLARKIAFERMPFPIGELKGLITRVVVA